MLALFCLLKCRLKLQNASSLLFALCHLLTLTNKMRCFLNHLSQVSQAVSLRRRCILHYALMTWQSWLAKRQARHLQCARGAQHLHSRRLLSVWVTWLDRVRAWQRKRAAASAADNHYVGRRLHLSVSALRCSYLNNWTDAILCMVIEVQWLWLSR
jgi:hypothetical protein